MQKRKPAGKSPESLERRLNGTNLGPDAGLVHFHWPRHEFINAVTHFIGLVLALSAAPVLIVMASLNGTPEELYTFIVYSASLILLYLVSTLYHAWPHGRTKKLLQKMDHMMVYVLIAGTYTPFLVAALGGWLGWGMFFLQWTLAATGIAIKAKRGIQTARDDFISTVAYLLMGWVGLIAIVPMVDHLPPESFTLVLAGGIAYTVGTVFYLWESMPFNHGIWHVIVLVASACHFAAVFNLL